MIFQTTILVQKGEETSCAASAMNANLTLCCNDNMRCIIIYKPQYNVWWCIVWCIMYMCIVYYKPHIADHVITVWYLRCIHLQQGSMMMMMKCRLEALEYLHARDWHDVGYIHNTSHYTISSHIIHYTSHYTISSQITL